MVFGVMVREPLSRTIWNLAIVLIDFYPTSGGGRRPSLLLTLRRQRLRGRSKLV